MGALEEKQAIVRYIDVIKDMYKGAIITVRTTTGEGSTLGPFFALIMDEFIRNTRWGPLVYVICR